MPSPEPFDVYAWRKAERARLLEARRAMPLEAYRDASAAIMTRLRERLPPGSQPLVGCYWPFRREFNCIPYMREVMAAECEVALPVVVGRGEPLIFRQWREGAAMETGVWNIPHPAGGPAVVPTALVIPLVGFDPHGYRLGYGAGYYDATLASFAHHPVTVGVGFEFSFLPTIHPQPHDVPLDSIITEKELRETPSRL